MKNLTKNKIIKWAKKTGLTIAIGHPSEWGITCPKKRAYSYSILNNNGLWDAPTDIQCYSLKTLLSDITHLAWAKALKKY